MDYISHIDFEAFAKAGPTERITLPLMDHSTGSVHGAINVIQVPPGGGSPAGRHIHVFEQIYYIISGTMDLEIDGHDYKAGPGDLIRLPIGVPHKNWNAGKEPVVHLALMIPHPEPGKALGIPVD